MRHEDSKQHWENLIRRGEKFARWAGAQHSRAQDASQDAVLVILEKLRSGQLEATRSPEGLGHCVIWRTLRRERAQQHRRAWRLAEYGSEVGHGQSSPPPETAFAARQALEFLDKMPAEAREIWLLQRVESWSVQEISNTLDIPLRTVYRRISQAEAWLDKNVRSCDAPLSLPALLFFSRTTQRTAPGVTSLGLFAVGVAALVLMSLRFNDCNSTATDGHPSAAPPSGAPAMAVDEHASARPGPRPRPRPSSMAVPAAGPRLISASATESSGLSPGDLQTASIEPSSRTTRFDRADLTRDDAPLNRHNAHGARGEDAPQPALFVVDRTSGTLERHHASPGAERHESPPGEAPDEAKAPTIPRPPAPPRPPPPGTP